MGLALRASQVGLENVDHAIGIAVVVLTRVVNAKVANRFLVSVLQKQSRPSYI